MQFDVLHQQILRDIPSASGITQHDGFFYVIGDDSPYLFKLNDDLNIVSQFLLHEPGKDLQHNRIEKKDKPIMKL